MFYDSWWLKLKFPSSSLSYEASFSMLLDISFIDDRARSDKVYVVH